MDKMNLGELDYFLKKYVSTGIKDIYAEQKLIAANKIYSHKAYRSDGGIRSRSFRLQEALENPDYKINAYAGALDAEIKYPTYIRFLDMKRLGNYKIYNRPIWGILYKRTFVDIKYELGTLCRKIVSDNLQASLR